MAYPRETVKILNGQGNKCSRTNAAGARCVTIVHGRRPFRINSLPLFLKTIRNPGVILDNLRKHGWRDSEHRLGTENCGPQFRIPDAPGRGTPVTCFFRFFRWCPRVLRTPGDDAIHTRTLHFVFVVIPVAPWHPNMCCDRLDLRSCLLPKLTPLWRLR